MPKRKAGSEDDEDDDMSEPEDPGSDTELLEPQEEDEEEEEYDDDEDLEEDDDNVENVEPNATPHDAFLSYLQALRVRESGTIDARVMEVLHAIIRLRGFELSTNRHMRKGDIFASNKKKEHLCIFFEHQKKFGIERARDIQKIRHKIPH